MGAINTPPGYVLVAEHADDTLVAASVPVDGTPDTPVRVSRVVVPCLAGDILDITAEIRLTNDLGYTVGVGARLQYYDYDDGVPWPHQLPWVEIPTPTGDNVTPDRHHLPISLTRVYQVPQGWPPPDPQVGPHRLTVNLMLDGHSTSYRRGDKLTIDGYGQQLVVRRWSAAA